MNFLEKLDYLMQKEKINKNILSKNSGIPYTTIDGFYKKGYQNTKLSTIQKLATYFNVSLDYLIFDEIVDLDYGKVDKFKVTTDEMYFIEKYRKLDDYDKEVVNSTLLQLYINAGRRELSAPAISCADMNKAIETNDSKNEISATKENDSKVVEIPKREKQIWEEPGKEYLMPKASHDKEGEFTEEDYKHDDDLMNDESIWK